MLTVDSVMQCYSGTEAPCAYGELISIGGIGGAKNKEVCCTGSGVEGGTCTALFCVRLEASKRCATQQCTSFSPSADGVAAACLQSAQQISAALSKVLKAKLNIEPNRFYLKVRVRLIYGY